MGISPLSTYGSLITAANQLNSNSSKSTASAAESLLQQDTHQLSGPAQVYQQLQQLSETNPSQFKQLTAQIASNLQQTASQAQASGNTTEANSLNQLAAQFQTSSQTGQPPELQPGSSASAGGGRHHGHHHHGGGAPSLAQSAYSSSSNSNSSDIFSALQSSSSNSLSLLASLAPTTTASIS